MDSSTNDDAIPARKRVAAACEACRVTKSRCRPSEQPGVCRKCLENKRECVSRSVPRPRRAKRAAPEAGCPFAASASQSLGQSTTFSLDFDVSLQDTGDDSFEDLRDSHSRAMDLMLPPDPLEFWSPEDSTSSSNLDTFSSEKDSSRHPSSHTMQSLHTKPQFNLSSAEGLLDAFRAMLTQFPCIILPPDVSVMQLAATKPFILLAILSAASGSRSLQGNALYDEEFRKVLGLKYVASGERSLEMLQGIVIYCAWYPFHLRPRNKQSMQYAGFATALCRDLGLDHDFRRDHPRGEGYTDEELEKIRTFLGHLYMLSTFLFSWKKHRMLTGEFTPWVAACCNILESNAQCPGDRVLASLARLSGIISDAAEAALKKDEQTEQQYKLMVLGLESQASSIQKSLPPDVAFECSVKLSSLFASIYLDGAVQLDLPRSIRLLGSNMDPHRLSMTKLVVCTATIREYFDCVLSLDTETISRFAGADWGKLIFVVIIALRLSFHLTGWTTWDSAWARSQLRLGDFLTEFCKETDLTPATNKVDILSASRVVMRTVLERYQKRAALADISAEALQADLSRMSCPILDNTLAEYLPTWDNRSARTSSGYISADSSGQSMFPDLWPNMTPDLLNQSQNSVAGEGFGPDFT